MKITLDLTEKELWTIATSLKERQNGLWKWYNEENSNMENRKIDSESVDALCHGIYKMIATIDDVLEKLDDADSAARSGL